MAIIQNCSDPRLLNVIEASLFEYLKWRATQLDGDVSDNSLFKRIYTGYPLDGIFLTRLTQPAIDTVIKNVITYFQDRRQSFRWYIGPTTTPPNLATYLSAYGFICGDTRLGMAINLQDIRATFPVPDNLRITRVSSPEMMSDWLKVELANAGVPGLADQHQTMLQTAEAIGFDDDLPLQRFIGYLGEVSVATSQIFDTGQVVRIDFVSALPDVRRRGIGTAISLAPLRVAEARGHKVAVLWALPMGIPIFRRIGFTDYCEINIYRYPYKE
jgi:GNAT superfamily N-acetyltransferase